jgi:hypothetical protein
MSTKRPDTKTGTDTTQPNEIPTAIMEHAPFGDEHSDADTAIEHATLDGTPTPGASSPGFKKLRRPTESEIVRAVDQVNTESVDMGEVVQARAAQKAEEEDEEAAEEEEEDEQNA